MPSKVLETVLTGRNLLSPVLTGAAADVEAFDAKVTAANGRASESSAASAKAQETASAKVAASNVRSAAASEAMSAKVAAANAKASESSRAFADITESSAARASLAWTRMATVGLPLAGAAVAVVTGKMAGDYQQLVTKLETTAGELPKNLHMVGQGMLDMAGQVGISADELAKGMYTVESAGFHGADALKVLKASGQGAKQETADLGKVADAVSTILHDYHLPASQAATVTSELVTAVSHGKTTFDELTGSLHSVTPLASVLGVTIADVTGTLSAMTASGESADQATQNMADTLRHLVNPTATMTSELAQLGITSSDLSDDLSTKGLAGTLQLVETAIVDHMDPATKRVLLPALNASKTAAQDLKIMMGSMPPALAKASQSLLDGSTSITDYQKAAKGMGGEQAAMALQFLSLYKNSDGFNGVLKQGGPAAQAFTAAMAKSFGTASALNVALMTTGENAAATNASIADIGKASASASGDIKGWDEVQGNFNQKLAQAGAEAKSLAIEAGQHLLPVLTSMVSWVGTTGLPGIEHLGHGVGDVAHWFGELPGPVRDFALALGGLALAEKIGLLDKLGAGAGRVSGAFTHMREEVQLQQALYGMQASGLSDVERALGGAESASSRFGVTAGTVARGGLTALKSAGSGLVSMFGGPWGLALAGAALGIGALNSVIQHHDEEVKKATDDVAKWYKTLALGGSSGDVASAQKHLEDLRAKIKSMQDGIDDYNRAAASGSARGGIGSLISQQKDLRDELAKGQKQWDDYRRSLSPTQLAAEDLAAAQAQLEEALKHGTGSHEAQVAAAHYNDELARQKSLTDQVTAAEQTQIDKTNQLANVQLAAVSSTLGDAQAQASLADAVAQYNVDAQDGQHSTKQLADESNNLAQQAISAAEAAGKHAADQAKANGVTDDGTIANKAILDSLKASAAQITGPGHDALVTAITDLEKTTIGAGTLADTVTKMGITVAGVWDANTQVLAGATAQQIQDLKNLGMAVYTLPNGKVVVTSDTGPARDQMQALVDSYKNYTININPQGMALTTAQRNALYSGKAAGGPIHGPGTGTSDTAGLFALSNGEHVWTAAETAAAGGHAGVEALRKAVLASGRGRASGGPAEVTEPARFSDAYIAAAQALIAKMGAMAKANATFTGGGVSGGNAANRALGQQIAASMGLGGQFPAVDFVFSHESGWNNLAQNPTSTAYGIAQFLDSTWATVGGHKTSDPSLQIEYGLKYMNKYGGPNGAAAFWQGHHWYKDGTNYVPSDQLAVLHRGEAVVPAAQNQGAPWSPAAMPGYGRSGGGVTVVHHHYDEGKRTEIKVDATGFNADQIAAKVTARQHEHEFLTGG